jgi:hypothetical protein
MAAANIAVENFIDTFPVFFAWLARLVSAGEISSAVQICLQFVRSTVPIVDTIPEKFETRLLSPSRVPQLIQ